MKKGDTKVYLRREQEKVLANKTGDTEKLSRSEAKPVGRKPYVKLRLGHNSKNAKPLPRRGSK